MNNSVTMSEEVITDSVVLDCTFQSDVGDGEKPDDNFDTKQIDADLVETEVTQHSQNNEEEEEEEEERQKIDENVNKTEQLNAKPNRELKLLLELSKEANLDTNIAYKRKSFEAGKLMEKQANRGTASLTGDSRDESGKRSMRSQNPEFLLKHKYMSRFITDSEHAENVDKPINETPNKPQKKKKESLGEIFIGGAIDEKTRKLLKPVLAMVQNDKDGFCWRCHRDKITISCGTCPRSYHTKCLKQSVPNNERWVCPECVSILKAESTKTRSPSMRGMTLEHLCNLLKFALKRMVQVTDAEPFIHPVNTIEFPDYIKYIVQPMDLTRLQKNIKENLYGSTNAFEADAKWMLHNSIIFNSYQSKLTSVAKSIIKVCKQEMQEIENCANCYLNANTRKEWFVEVCPKPHVLLWAKLKGFPYWPAKAMSTNSQGMVDVRFFGAHDRAWVPFKECFLFSQKDPNCNKQKRNDINECLKEVDVHIENLKKIYGEFYYAPYRTPYEPDIETKQLQVFLPNYMPKMKSFSEIKIVNEKTPNSEVSENKERENFNGSAAIESSTRKTGSDNSLDIHQSKSDDLSKEMEGYGTDDESDLVNFKDSSMSDEVDEDKPEEETVCENDNKTAETSDVNILKRPLNDNLNSAQPQKIVRRISLSESNKINKVNIAEGMEITLSNEENSLRISENSSSDKLTETEIDSTSTQITSSPNDNCKIANKLMKKLSDDEKQVNASAKKVVAKNKSLDNISKQKPTSENETNIIQIKQIILGDNQNTLKENSNNSNTSQLPKSNNQNNNSNNKKTERSTLKDTGGSDDFLEEMYSEAIEADQTNENHTESLKNRKKSETKKRKRNFENDTNENVRENSPIQNKLIKLVDINMIKKSLCDKMGPELVTSTILEKHLRKLNPTTINNDNSSEAEKSADIDSCVIKSEPNSDEEANDESYMEAKLQYLSALNISEKVPDSAKDATTQKKFKVVDNLTRVIDSVASTYSEQHKGEEVVLQKEKTKVTPKHRARKTFPKPPIVTAKQITPVTSQNLVNTPTVNTVKTVNATTADTQKISNVLFLTQPHPGISNITVLPPNQTIAYSTGVNSPMLTFVQHTVPTPFANGINPSATNVNLNASQNYIPQRDPAEINSELVNQAANNTETATSEPVHIENPAPPPTNITTVTNTETPNNNNGVTGVSNVCNFAVPALVPSSSSKQTTNSDLSDEISFLSGIVPENITKAITDLMCRAPPKLKPRPPGALSNNFDPGVPSSAGSVTNYINSVSHKLSDYFRGILIETLQDMGKAENAEALITCLKLENEALKHKHAEELLEIKKNVSSILRDIQKSILEEKERIVEETRASCEVEMIKRIEEAKAKQWCANCMKEAQFYCCWNTSYCDYPCQLKHWPKHMTKCAQNAGPTVQNLSSNNSPKVPGQPLILRKTTTPKTFPGKTLIAKPTNVIMNKGGSAKVSVGTVVKTSSGNTLTIVEPTPGNYELVGNGPISVGGKIINTTVLNKIKSANVISVTSSANNTLSSVGSTATSQKFIVTQSKSTPVKLTTSESQK